MGWIGYENKIDIGMLFKKMYCHKCGNLLKRKKITNLYKKGEHSYTNFILGRPTIGMNRIQKCYYIYVCPNCGLEITYDKQCIIAKQQKKDKKKNRKS